MSAGTKEEEEIVVEALQEPKLTSFQKLLALKKQKQKVVDEQLKNILKTKDESDIINFIKAERKSKMNTTMTTESSIVKRLEISMDRKSRFNKSYANIKEKTKINFNHVQTEPL